MLKTVALLIALIPGLAHATPSGLLEATAKTLSKEKVRALYALEAPDAAHAWLSSFEPRAKLRAETRTLIAGLGLGSTPVVIVETKQVVCVLRKADAQALASRAKVTPRRVKPGLSALRIGVAELLAFERADLVFVTAGAPDGAASIAASLFEGPKLSAEPFFAQAVADRAEGDFAFAWLSPKTAGRALRALLPEDEVGKLAGFALDGHQLAHGAGPSGSWVRLGLGAQGLKIAKELEVPQTLASVAPFARFVPKGHHAAATTFLDSLAALALAQGLVPPLLAVEVSGAQILLVVSPSYLETKDLAAVVMTKSEDAAEALAKEVRAAALPWSKKVVTDGRFVIAGAAPVVAAIQAKEPAQTSLGAGGDLAIDFDWKRLPMAPEQAARAKTIFGPSVRHGRLPALRLDRTPDGLLIRGAVARELTGRFGPAALATRRLDYATLEPTTLAMRARLTRLARHIESTQATPTFTDWFPAGPMCSEGEPIMRPVKWPEAWQKAGLVAASSHYQFRISNLDQSSGKPMKRGFFVQARGDLDCDGSTLSSSATWRCERGRSSMTPGSSRTTRPSDDGGLSARFRARADTRARASIPENFPWIRWSFDALDNTEPRRAPC